MPAATVAKERDLATFSGVVVGVERFYAAIPAPECAAAPRLTQPACGVFKRGGPVCAQVVLGAKVGIFRVVSRGLFALDAVLVTDGWPGCAVLLDEVRERAIKNCGWRRGKDFDTLVRKPHRLMAWNPGDFIRSPGSLQPIAGLLASPPASAESVLRDQARADLDLMVAWAGQMEDSRIALRLLDRLSQDAGPYSSARLRESLGRPGNELGPIRYCDTVLVTATARWAQVLAALLAADLDIDRSMTLDEIARVLHLNCPNALMSDLFLQFALDLDDRFSPAVLAKGAADAGAAQMSGRDDQSMLLGAPLDLDADGQITAEELDRAAAALRARSGQIACISLSFPGGARQAPPSRIT